MSSYSSIDEVIRSSYVNFRTNGEWVGGDVRVSVLGFAQQQLYERGLGNQKQNFFER